MKAQILLVVLAVALASGVEATVRSVPVGLATFDSFAAKASESQLTTESFDSFVRMRAEGVALPRFKSSPANGAVLIFR